jgi:hypothetical protein
MKESPKFQHDCDRCTYLGTVQNKGGHFFDLYWCANASHPALSSVLCRYGSEGPEYSSSHPPEAFAGPEEFIALSKQYERPYIHAMARAVRMGLYSGKFAKEFTDCG